MAMIHPFLLFKIDPEEPDTKVLESIESQFKNFFNTCLKSMNKNNSTYLGSFSCYIGTKDEFPSFLYWKLLNPRLQIPVDDFDELYESMEDSFDLETASLVYRDSDDFRNLQVIFKQLSEGEEVMDFTYGGVIRYSGSLKPSRSSVTKEIKKWTNGNNALFSRKMVPNDTWQDLNEEERNNFFSRFVSGITYPREETNNGLNCFSVLENTREMLNFTTFDILKGWRVDLTRDYLLSVVHDLLVEYSSSDRGQPLSVNEFQELSSSFIESIRGMYVFVHSTGSYHYTGKGENNDIEYTITSKGEFTELMHSAKVYGLKVPVRDDREELYLFSLAELMHLKKIPKLSYQLIPDGFTAATTISIPYTIKEYEDGQIPSRTDCLNDYIPVLYTPGQEYCVDILQKLRPNSTEKLTDDDVSRLFDKYIEDPYCEYPTESPEEIHQAITALVKHIEFVYCQDDKPTIKYVANWILNPIVEPRNNATTTMLLISGQEATGKSSIFEALKRLIFQKKLKTKGNAQYMKESGFNSSLKEKLVVVLEELPEDILASGIWDWLKDLIENPEIDINAKHVDEVPMTNYIRYAGVTNHDLKFPEGKHRRIAYLPIKNHYAHQETTRKRWLEHYLNGLSNKFYFCVFLDYLYENYYEENYDFQVKPEKIEKFTNNLSSGSGRPTWQSMLLKQFNQKENGRLRSNPILKSSNSRRGGYRNYKLNLLVSDDIYEDETYGGILFEDDEIIPFIEEIIMEYINERREEQGRDLIYIYEEALEDLRPFSKTNQWLEITAIDQDFIDSITDKNSTKMTVNSYLSLLAKHINITYVALDGPKSSYEVKWPSIIEIYMYLYFLKMYNTSDLPKISTMDKGFYLEEFLAWYNVFKQHALTSMEEQIEPIQFLYCSFLVNQFPITITQYSSLEYMEKYVKSDAHSTLFKVMDFLFLEPIEAYTCPNELICKKRHILYSFFAPIYINFVSLREFQRDYGFLDKKLMEQRKERFEGLFIEDIYGEFQTGGVRRVYEESSDLMGDSEYTDTGSGTQQRGDLLETTQEDTMNVDHEYGVDYTGESTDQSDVYESSFVDAQEWDEEGDYVANALESEESSMSLPSSIDDPILEILNQPNYDLGKRQSKPVERFEDVIWDEKTGTQIGLKRKGETLEREPKKKELSSFDRFGYDLSDDSQVY
jgi:hypothetical protein